MDEIAGADKIATVGQRLLSLCLLAAMAFEILAHISASPALQHAAWGAVVLATVFSRRRFGLRETYLLSFCALLALLVWARHPTPGAVIAAALDQASFLMAFILLLGLLHEAAGTSPAVTACGKYLTQQPPGRRYYALYTGTGVMAVLFNIGMVSFLVPLILRGIATANPGDARNPIRERRQISAMLRGFGWSVIWSPTAIAPLAVAELIPGTNRQIWILLGLAIYLIVMVIGALEDGIRFRAYKPTGRRVSPRFPRRAARRFVLACLWLLSMAGAIATLTDDTIIFGLMVSCPIMLMGWLLVQYRGSATMTIGRLKQIFYGLPQSAPVAVTLAASGFLGRAAAALVPAVELARLLGFEAMPDFVLLSLLPVAIAVLSLLALSPIMMAVFFGSLFGGLPVLPADPTLIALAISCGWALSTTFSPFATVVLLINRVSGIAPRTLTWRWNLAYSVFAALALVPIFAFLTGGS